MKSDSWERVAELFEAALQLPPKERPDFLDEACAGKEGLRERVEELLANHEEAEANGFLEGAPVVNSMELAPGTQLGHYKLLAAIGAGGMGEVYRAQDTRLERIVAVKVLPSHLARDTDLRQRFEREARAVSSLNHPHICTLYDIGREDGIDFLVMEYIEGETLASRVTKGPLPLEQVLRYGNEIADALDKAHRQGVIHRDLKPGNIMVTKSGTKLLDFGLAKLDARRRQGPVEATSTPTKTKAEPLTGKGTIIGTLQYMAPEQLEGEEVDARTDIFAFGTVLYEMLTGVKAFEGKSQASLIGAIMSSDPPPPSTLQKLTPPALDHVVKTCLAKDPDDRWQTAGDIGRQLKWIVEGGSQVLPITPGRKHSKQLTWAAVGLIVGAIVASLLWNVMRPSSPAPARLQRLIVQLPAEAPYASPGSLALSPDGSRLVYIAINEGTPYLYLRSLNQLEAQRIPGTEFGQAPFFSPDGEWVGFFTYPEGKLKKVSLRGGPPSTLSDVVKPLGGSWGPDDTIVLAGAGEGQLFRVPAAGGTPEVLVNRDSTTGEVRFAWPDILPGGEAAVVSIASGNSQVVQGQIAVVSLKTGKHRTVIESGYHARYAPSGHLVYVLQGTLMAAPFDLDRLETTGPPVRVLQGLRVDLAVGFASFAFSSDGSLVYVSSPQPGKRMLVWVDRQGQEVAPFHESPLENPRRVRLSPDGRRVAVVTGPSREGDLWIYDRTGRPPTRLTFDGLSGDSIWSPDGLQVAFSSSRAGPQNLFRISADGSNPEPEHLAPSPYSQFPRSWSPDGIEILIDEYSQGTGTSGDIVAIPTRGEPEPRVVLKTELTEGLSALSSDGRWLVYVAATGAGGFDLWVQPYPGPGAPMRISRADSTEPVWGPEDREIFYLERNKMMVVAVSTEPEFRAEAPKVLFESQYVHDLPRSYDVDPDGRFLMIKPTPGEQLATKSKTTEMVLVLNWFDELKQLVPTD